MGRHMDEFGKWTLKIARPRDFVRFTCEMDIAAA